MIKFFITTLTRFRTSSILNIGGLTVAYIAFIIISLQIIAEYSFDKSFDDGNRIYRIERPAFNDTTRWDVSHSRPVIDIIISSSPEIEQSAVIRSNYRYSPNGMWRLEGTIGEAGLVSNSPVEMSNEFAEMFDVEIIEGVASNDSQKVIIPKSMSDRLSNGESLIGKILTYIEATDRKVEICGVYKDFPKTSSFHNKMFSGISDRELGMYNYRNYVCFVKLREGADPSIFSQTINRVVNEAAKAVGVGGGYIFRLHGLRDIHFSLDCDITSGVEYADKQKINLFGSFAILILIIASINYVNFATALVPQRMRGVNTRKIYGATLLSLRMNFIGEAIFISVMAYVVAVLVVCLVGNLSEVSFIPTQVDISDSLGEIVAIGGFSLLLGLLAGLYPAIYSTSANVAYVLKGSFSLSQKGRIFRSALIGFQFVISIGLIIVSIFMNLQFDMIKNQDLGVDIENVIRINVSGRAAASTEELKEKFSSIAGVTEVTNTHLCIVGSEYSRYVFIHNNVEDIKIYNMHGPSNVVDFFGFKVIEGRNFTADDDLKLPNSTVLINRTAQRRYNFKVGEKIDKMNGINNGYWVQNKVDGKADWEIIGVVDDFNFKPLYAQVEPLMIINYGTESNSDRNTIYVKAVSSDYPALIKNIASIVKEFDDNSIADIAFLNSAIEELYQSDMRSASLVGWFSLLAILISLAGVFGLVHFEVGHRRKEIGLRKINGAAVVSILMMICRKFIVIVVVCFLITVPFIIYFVDDWLSIFAYRTPLYWWVFASAALIILFVTLVTVLIQSYRAATDNPINSIKTE